MNNDQTRRLAMLGRVSQFRSRYGSEFAADSEGARLLGLAAAAATEATAGVTAQSSSSGNSRAGTATKLELYEGLLDDLRAMSATSKSIARRISGLDEKFRLPRSISQFNIITAARAFLRDATPLEAEFIKCEMAADFLQDLEDDMKAYDKAEDDQGDGTGKRVGATRTIAGAISDGCDAVRDLDPLMKNKYKHDAAKLAEWFTASHVERATRKTKVAVPTVTAA